MKLLITSDYPLKNNKPIQDYLNATVPIEATKIAFIDPYPRKRTKHYKTFRDQFIDYGFHHIEYFGLRKKLTKESIEDLVRYEIAYLLGGTPQTILTQIKKSGFKSFIPEYNNTCGIIISASGSSMALSKNFSLFKLFRSPVEETVRTYDDMKGLELIPYEILPHYERYDESFIEKIKIYSQRVNTEIYGLYDGSALIYDRGKTTPVGKGIKVVKGKVKGVRS